MYIQQWDPAWYAYISSVLITDCPFLYYLGLHGIQAGKPGIQGKSGEAHLVCLN